MKKINYMTPQTTVTELKLKTALLDGSNNMLLDRSSENRLTNSSDILVKDGRQSDYNVWGDDWSK